MAMQINEDVAKGSEWAANVASTFARGNVPTSNAIKQTAFTEASHAFQAMANLRLRIEGMVDRLTGSPKEDQASKLGVVQREPDGIFEVLEDGARHALFNIEKANEVLDRLESKI